MTHAHSPDRGQTLRRTLTAAPLLLAGTAASAFEVNEQLELNGLMAGAYQCQQVGGVPDADDACRGGGAFQPELFYNPTEQDQFFVKLGFGAGNGLNEISPFSLAPWAADLEDDVKDINGRGRSYLLEAWYAHTFRLGEANSVQITAGLIDPAFYVNENAYANDEFTQFSNEIFVNSRNGFLPAYDAGGVIVWKLGSWTFSGVGMNVGGNDDGNSYNWFAAEIDYNLTTRLGEGNYRLMVSGTSSEFSDPTGTRDEPLAGLLLSFDQELGPNLGAFLRFAWQREDALVDHKADYSGGFDINGALWGRERDNIGLGYAYLEGGNADIRSTQAVEGYYRLGINDFLALTADVQWMQDRIRNADGPEGWIFGMRAVAEF
jgi:porin